MVYECDNCGRELDEDDAYNGACVCGCAIPFSVAVKILPGGEGDE